VTPRLNLQSTPGELSRTIDRGFQRLGPNRDRPKGLAICPTL
jgi:hypothetical protein